MEKSCAILVILGLKSKVAKIAYTGTMRGKRRMITIVTVRTKMF